MKNILKYLKHGVLLTIVMLVICGMAYPAAMTGLGQVLFPNQANGSLITSEGKPTANPEEAVGSAIVGQDFSGDSRYFQGRVSSVGYNTYTAEQLENGEYAGVSSGSFNYGASRLELKSRVRDDINEFIENHPGVKKSDIPADLLTASGSGLDPDITPESAKVQIPAISEATGLSIEELKAIVEKNTQEPVAGIFGHERVNVLRCNLDIAAAIGEI